jgi:hypothetical protein
MRKSLDYQQCLLCYLGLYNVLVVDMTFAMSNIGYYLEANRLQSTC